MQGRADASCHSEFSSTRYADDCINQNSKPLNRPSLQQYRWQRQKHKFRKVQPELINNCFLKCVNKRLPQPLPVVLLMRQDWINAVKKISSVSRVVFRLRIWDSFSNQLLVIESYYYHLKSELFLAECKRKSVVELVL